MAAPSARDELLGDAFCPICLEYFREPVSIHCGHHFCRSCIERCWEWPRARFACPRCRDTAPERSLRPSRELARVLEIARRLSRGEALRMEHEEEEEGCQRHREPLELFCKEDGALLCAICRESRAHRAHTVLPVPQVVREYKGQIEARLQILKDGRDKLLELRDTEMRKNWEYLEETEAERQRILSQFQGLRLSLEDHCRHLLARLRDLERDIEKVQEENMTSLTKEISRLDSRVQELEEKCRQADRTFLQDISGAFSRLGKENLQLPSSPLPELEKKIHHFREKNLLLEEELRNFQDILMFELPEKMTVTLDPSTAHPQLLVAPDGSSVSWERAREPPGNGPGTDPPWDGTAPGTDPPGDGTGTGTDPPGNGNYTDPPETIRGTDPPGNGTGTDPPWDGTAPGTDPPGDGTAPGTDPPGDGTDTDPPETAPGTDPPWDGNYTDPPGNGTYTDPPETAPGTDPPGNGPGTDPPGDGDYTEPPWDGTGTDPPGDGTGTDPPGNGAAPGTDPPGDGPGTDPSVLGREAVTGGRRCWDVQVAPAGSWALGVARESPEDGGESPEWELWSMGLCQGQFWALTSLERIPLFPGRAPSRVRVALDYDRGQVAFFDADKRRLIFAFPAASFEGQSVHPWFLVWGEGSRITLSP